MARVTITDIQKMKLEKKKIVVMTAYDYSMASIIDRANVDILLVGDSGGRNLLGHEDNNSVTMDEMVLMTRSVSRGAKRALVIGDMPFMTYQVSKEKALRNAGRLIQEAGAQAVKLEVGADYAATVEAVVKAGIPVMAQMASPRWPRLVQPVTARARSISKKKTSGVTSMRWWQRGASRSSSLVFHQIWLSA